MHAAQQTQPHNHTHAINLQQEHTDNGTTSMMPTYTTTQLHIRSIAQHTETRCCRCTIATQSDTHEYAIAQCMFFRRTHTQSHEQSRAQPSTRVSKHRHTHVRMHTCAHMQTTHSQRAHTTTTQTHMQHHHARAHISSLTHTHTQSFAAVNPSIYHTTHTYAHAH